MKSVIVFTLSLLSVCSLYGQVKEIPYTLDDRDRLIRVEEQIKALDKRIDDMNKRIDDMNNRIDDMNNRMDDMNKSLNGRMNDMMNLMYVILAGIFVLIGFVIWDRRTAVAPVARDIKRVKEILNDLAKVNPEFGEIIKRAAI